MGIKITLDFDTALDAMHYCAALAGVNVREAAASAPSAPASAPPPAGVITPDGDPAGAVVGLAEVRQAVEEMTGATGLPAVRALLTNFGVGRIKELPVENYGAFVAAAKAATKAALA